MELYGISPIHLNYQSLPVIFYRNKKIILVQKNEAAPCFICKKFSITVDLGWQWHTTWPGKKHVMIHSGEKSCVSCVPRLLLHREIFRNIFKYTVDINYLVYLYFVWYLKEHIPVHSGGKPYKCEQCPQVFTMSEALEQHIRVHTGEWPYKCKQCPQVFTDSGNIQKHIQIHSGDKLFRCK